jgi:deoxyuridine 5'-triphosphate nucleotidohydrolase
MTTLLVNRLTTTSKLPYKKYESDAGFDLSCDENFEIKPWDKTLVNTGISFTVPEGTYGQIAPRSSVSMKGVFVNAGVIDRTYTGEVRILLFNMTNKIMKFTQGDRIAQLIIKKIDNPKVMEYDIPLNNTERGSNGFGSTGQ